MTVGEAFQERRPVAAASVVGGALRDGPHLLHVVSVDLLGRHVVGGRAGADVAAGRDRGHRRELAVQVVLAHEEHRQPAHAGEVQAFVEVAVVGGAVAEEGHGDAAGALQREAGAGGGGDAPADDPEAADQAVLEVDHVHRAGPAAAHARAAAHQLGRERPRLGAHRERGSVAAVGGGHAVAAHAAPSTRPPSTPPGPCTGAPCRAPRRAGTGAASRPRTRGCAPSARTGRAGHFPARRPPRRGSPPEASLTRSPPRFADLVSANDCKDARALSSRYPASARRERNQLDCGIAAPSNTLLVTGHTLTPADVADVALRGRPVEVAPAARERMEAARGGARAGAGRGPAGVRPDDGPRRPRGRAGAARAGRRAGGQDRARPGDGGRRAAARRRPCGRRCSPA